MDLFSLAAKLTLDTGEYERGIESARSAAANFAKGLTSVVTAVSTTDRAVNNAADSAETLGAETANAADGVDALRQAESDVARTSDNAADSIGSTADAVSELQDSSESVTRTIGESADSMNDAAGEAKDLSRELDRAESEFDDTEDAVDDYTESADDAAKSTRKLGDEEEKTAKKTSTFKDTLKALLSRDMIVGGLKALWSGVQQIGRAFINLGKSAVDAYGNYEQLVGGVETLFDKTSAEVEKVGAKAIKALSDDVWDKLGEQTYKNAGDFIKWENSVESSFDAVQDAMTYGIGTAAEDMDGYLKYLQKSYGMNAQDAQTMADAVSKAIKSNINDMGDYAKNMAGIKSAADIVKENAANAFKTAGMSANEYMEMVTSFSASLLQGLGGDTAKAAKIADVAISDMSDNANKMGTDMQSIQNAYQGFSKQNYTIELMSVV